MLSHPKQLKRLIERYRESPKQNYDFDGDPEGHILWYLWTREYVSKHPTNLQLDVSARVEEVLEVVVAICKQFKRAIEYNGLHSLLYKDNTCVSPKREEAAQKVFLGIASAYCEANNLDLSPETNLGRGSVDFKVSSGFEGRVLVELKLSSNRRLLHGYSKQIREYQQAELTEYAVFLVIDVGGCTKARWDGFHDAIDNDRRKGRRMPLVLKVNGKRRLPASKMN